MTDAASYALVVTPRAQRTLADRLPESVAVAVIDFLTMTLVNNPHRVGKRLGDELAGIWSARRATYLILYEIDEKRRKVVVLRIEHRRDAYRPF